MHELKVDPSIQNYEPKAAYRQSPIGLNDIEAGRSLISRASKCHDAYSDGISGQFVPLANDFSMNRDMDVANSCNFSDQPHWTGPQREKVKRFRYVICTMALIAVALSLMSRMILNIAIVDMVMHDTIDSEEYEPSADGAELVGSNLATVETVEAEELTTISPVSALDQTTVTSLNSSVEISVEMQEFEDGLRHRWSQKEVNALLGAFYVGYSPAILFSGGIADRYGSKYPLLMAIAGSSIVNLLTPLMAGYNYTLLLSSRMMLGIIQGGVVPCLYDTFNKWLTASEASIFAPLIKVSMPLGSLMGAALPGVMAFFGFKWPFLFYVGSFSCLAWAGAWILLASSDPHKSKFVDPDELHKIIKKKVPRRPMAPTNVAVISNGDSKVVVDYNNPSGNVSSLKVEPEESNSTPWLLIITNPSVIALTIVKYTYNISMDFFYIELGLYLDSIHKASPEMRSLIASAGYLMQLLLIAFVGFAAKTLVAKRALGLSVTKWRKVFQGSSNFAMAAIYFMFPLFSDNLTSVAIMIMSIWFFWMLGAGGESLVPYDLSTRYPAAIVGFAHSISIFSGLSVPVFCTIVLGNDASSARGWNFLCIIIGSLAALGGLVFIIVLKAKPFLPGEKLEKRQRNISLASLGRKSVNKFK